MNTICYTGYINKSFFLPDFVELNQREFDLIEKKDWQSFELLIVQIPDWANRLKLGDSSFQNILHHLVLQNAPVDLVQKVVEAGAWRSETNIMGHTPYQLALKLGLDNLLPILTPTFDRHYDAAVFEKMEEHLHHLIRSWVKEKKRILPERTHFKLPKLTVLLESEKNALFFQIPGMYGGFRYYFNPDYQSLTVYRFVRIASGIGVEYLITPDQVEILRQGL